MTRWRAWRALPLLGACFLVAACSFSDEVLFRTFTGEAPAAPETTVAPEQVLGLGAPAPSLGQSRFPPPPVAAGPPARTPVGRAVAALRLKFLDLRAQMAAHDDELGFLRRSLAGRIEAYRAEVAALGLESGAPVSREQGRLAKGVETARTRLARVYGDLLKMNGLAAKVTVDAAQAAQLLEAVQEIRAQGGASAEDERQLEALEKEIDAAVLLSQRFLSALHRDIGTQTQYAGDQRRQLERLRRQVATVTPDARPTAPRTAAPPAAAPWPGAAPAPAFLAVGRPLVTIRFDRPGVDYEPDLFRAARAALERRPDARFDVVGLAARKTGGRAGAGAMERAEAVGRSLVGMGLPPERVSLSAVESDAVTGAEVRVYVRAPAAPSPGPGRAAAPAPAPSAPAAEKGARTAALSPPATMPPAAYHATRPLVTIQFDDPDVAYEEPLYEAVRAALARRPGATFDLVGVAAPRGDLAAGMDAAMRRARAVMKSLTAMGLPAERVTVEATTEAKSRVDRVMLFVR